MAVLRLLIDVVRGMLIGTVEIIPGVSGGTIALVVGVYDRLINSAGHLIRALVRGVADLVARRGGARARHHLGQVSWVVVIPVLIGMVIGVVTAAALLAPVIEANPVETRAVFFGLVLASLLVPIRMAGRWTGRSFLLAVPAAVLAFALTGLPPAGPFEPPLWLVALAAAVAVCALVLPGVSGSFLLVVVGLYAPTLAALNERDLAYIGVFGLGAILGLALFVPLLQWLLENRREIVLPIMTGLMLGSLRALWPWQAEAGGLQAPSGEILLIAALALAGVVAVLALLLLESRLVRSRVASGEDVLAVESEFEADPVPTPEQDRVD